MVVLAAHFKFYIVFGLFAISVCVHEFAQRWSSRGHTSPILPFVVFLMSRNLHEKLKSAAPATKSARHSDMQNAQNAAAATKSEFDTLASHAEN